MDKSCLTKLAAHRAFGPLLLASGMACNGLVKVSWIDAIHMSKLQKNLISGASDSLSLALGIRCSSDK